MPGLRCVAAILLFVLVWPASAFATACDCSRKTGSCAASGSIVGQTLIIRTGTRQCAMVTFSINGDPGSLTIAGGEGSTSYLATSSRRPVLTIDGCSVCGDDAGLRQRRDEQLRFHQCNLRCVDRVEAAIPGCRGDFNCLAQLNRQLENFCGC